MKNIKKFSLISFVFFLLVSHNPIFAAKDANGFETDYPVTGLTCYNTPEPSDPAIKKKLLDSLGIKETIPNVNLTAFYGGKLKSVKSNATLHINYKILYARHMVIYNAADGGDYAAGAGINQKTDDRKICGITGKRYIGFDERGFAIVDPMSYPDRSSDSSYFTSREFIKNPWLRASLPLDDIGTKPDPVIARQNVDIGIGDELKKDYLKRAVDIFSRNIGHSSQQFIDQENTKEYTLEEAAGSMKNYNPHLGTNIYNDKVFYDYAVFASRPTKFSPGVFYLYTEGSTVYYSSNFVAQLEDPLKSNDFDAIVETAVPTNTTFDNDNVDVEISFKLTSSSNPDLKLNSACVNPLNAPNKDINLLYCRTPVDDTRVHAGVRIEDAAGNSLKEFRVPISGSKLIFDLKADGAVYKTTLQEVLDSVGSDFVFPKTGSYRIKAWLPNYQDAGGIREMTYENNHSYANFKVQGPKNVSVSIDMTPLFPAEAEIDAAFRIDNSFDHAKSGKLTYYVTKIGSNTPIPMGENGPTEQVMNFNAPTNGADKKILSPKFVLEPGDYYLHAKVDEFAEEITHDDNIDKVKFTVDMFIPPNTVCDFVNAPYIETSNRKNLTDILDADSNADASNPKNGVSRTCIGYTPNYPSTVVEGGQKTFFYVAYKALAFPLPAYHVQNLDEFGIKQELTMKEPQDAVGSCSPKKELFGFTYDQTLEKPYVALENCTILDSFYYFPSEFNDSIKNKSQEPKMAIAKDWFGPYKVGAYDYYHYAYRGRLMPKLTKINIKILDPMKKELQPVNNLGLGELTFFFNKECYNFPDSGSTTAANPVLDLAENCRLIQLYVPGNPVGYTGSRQYFQLPEDNRPFTFPKEDDRIDFLNVGLHALEVHITEEHAYLYQKDEGSEYQGKKGVYRKDDSGNAATGPIDTTKVALSPKGFYEHLPRMVYDAVDNTEMKAKYNKPYMNHCYSTENANSSYGIWKGEQMEYHKDNPILNCIHDSNSDFYYWMYKWSEVRSIDSFYLFEYTFTPTTPTGTGYNNTFQ